MERVLIDFDSLSLTIFYLELEASNSIFELFMPLIKEIKKGDIETSPQINILVDLISIKTYNVLQKGTTRRKFRQR